MPAGIKDDALWQKAKNALKSQWDSLDNPWAAVMAKYKDMGGEADKGAEEACSSGAMGQLMRGEESVSMDGAENYISLNEATVNRDSRTIRAILITEGPGNTRTKNFYTDEFIKDAAIKYNGARAYLNHASEAEYRERPEGDIRELCGYYKNLSVTNVVDKQSQQTVLAVVGDLVCDESNAGNEALAKAEAQIEYARIFPDTKEEYCGLSICGSGKPGGQVDINGQKWNRIIGVGQADSVDVVTRPARGGAFLALTESAGTLPHLPLEESNMLKEAMAVLAEITETTTKLTEAKTDAERHLLKTKLESLKVKLTEATKKKEADPAADDDSAGSDAEDVSALKKLMPKGNEEADDMYEARIAKVKAMMGKKGKESAAPALEGMGADELRKNHPKLFEAVASRVRESVAEQGEDLKAVKTELRESKIKMQVLQDKELATTLLNESGVPAKFLNVGDLIGKTESEMKREIERVKAIIESGSGRTHVPGSVPVAAGGKLDQALSRILESAKA